MTLLGSLNQNDIFVLKKLRLVIKRKSLSLLELASLYYFTTYLLTRI